MLLLVIVFVSLSKIYSNHEFFSNRLAWYQRFINLVHSRQIHKATLSASYYVDKHPYAYWASQSEFALLSALAAPDSAVQIIVDADAVKLNKEESGQLSTTPYFKGITGRYVSLDSLYAKTVLDSLANVQQQ
jgi:hypothetical protein